MKQPPLTPIASLGEFGLIDHLTSGLTIHHKETLKGVGDDTAVIDTGDMLTLITKDLLVEGVHFDMAYSPLKHLGYKAVTVNLSDIYAMNGLPRQILVGLAVSSKYSLEALEALYEGIRLACDKYQVDLIGGDTSIAPAGMTISITAIGQVARNKVVYRKGASVNDLLCVSGNLGAAYCGLLVLEREKMVYRANPDMQPQINDYAYVLERQLKPEAGKHTVELLGKSGVLPTSMIDISDGLASEVLHLCKHSALGASIYEEKIPVDSQTAATATEFNINPITAALSGGEDYELLFTIKPADYEVLKELPGISIIGYMTAREEGTNLITNAGHLTPLTAQGWDSFNQQPTANS